MSEWISIKDELPPDDLKEIDVWKDGFRTVDVHFYGGYFKESILDGQGDFSHEEIMENVTHWMTLSEPTK